VPLGSLPCSSQVPFDSFIQGSLGLRRGTTVAKRWVLTVLTPDPLRQGSQIHDPGQYLLAPNTASPSAALLQFVRHVAPLVRRVALSPDDAPSALLRRYCSGLRSGDSGSGHPAIDIPRETADAHCYGYGYSYSSH
jgi:hypothetical protein